MTTKLTLRMDKILVAKAKREARHRGKSVSKMVAEYFGALGEEAHRADALPPVTASLFGLLKKVSVSEKELPTPPEGQVSSKVIVDTNVVLDVLLARQPHAHAAAKLFALAEHSRIDAWVCATTVTTVDYLLS